MPDDAARIRAQSARQDADISRKVAEFESDLYDVWRLLRERIIALTNRLTTRDGRVVANRVNLGVARAVARELEAALLESGYADLVEDAVREMGELAKYQGFGQRIVGRVEGSTAWSASTLDAFYTSSVAALMEVPAAMIRDFEQILLRGVVGAADRDSLVTAMMQLMEVKLPQARTIYDTAVTQFSQVAILGNTTGAADEAFLYDGPIDALMRPFCEDLVGKVYTRASIEEMDNGQMDNVLVTRGGYNCRHKWIPLVPENPMAKTADSGKYADPEYAKQVQEARAARERMKAAKQKARRT